MAHGFGRICQQPATQRLHDHDGLAMLARDFETCVALMHRVVPVEIVHLELHELDFGMLI